MKLLFIILLLISHVGYSLELKLGVEPIIDPSLMEKELVPLLEFANQEVPTRYVFSYSFSEVVNQIRTGEINAIYTSSSYFYLLKQLGFVPVLKSNQVLDQVVIYNPDEDQSEVSHSQTFNKLYYVKNDLSSMFRIRNMSQSNIKLVPTMTSEVAIFAVLKDSKAKAMIMQDELGLLDKVIRNKLKVAEKTGIGSVYLMVHKPIAKKLEDWWDRLAMFHSQFDDPKDEYNYLNIYDFKRFEGEDEYWENRQDEYMMFIQELLEQNKKGAAFTAP